MMRARGRSARAILTSMDQAARLVSAADGTLISYDVMGSGPALVLNNGLTTSTAFWKYVRPAWAERHQVITWDLPGHGRSERPRTLACVELEAQPEIIARVMDAAHVACATQVGFSLGCQISLEMLRQEPARCAAVALLLGTAGHVFDALRLPVGTLVPKLLLEMPPRLFALWYRSLARFANHSFARTLARQSGMVGSSVTDRDLRELLAHLAGLDPISLQRMAQSAARHSAEDVLATTEKPVLIIGGGKDPFAPLETVGRALHRLAPQSRLIELPKATHTALLEQADVIGAAVEEFLLGIGRA
jgi:pimeloyl-ACP methyl ester carboxylesterase